MTRIILLVALISAFITTKGQVSYKVEALVKDSTGQQIIGANVWLITGNDSLHTVTNNNGFFQFERVSFSSFTIRIRIMGYETFSNDYTYPADSNNIQLPVIILKIKSTWLKEVIVKSQLSPVTLKEDTLEYNIAQYHVRENTKIEDLLKRLPGIEIDRNGNINYMGQPISKIKISGKEYAVSNIQTLLKLIPLELLEKVQIIEDYGKLAELTGFATGSPTKTINLETKKQLNTTTNIQLTTGYGTSERYNTDLNGSKINGDKQLLFQLMTNNNDNMYAVKSEHSKAGFIYRNQLNNSLHTRGGIFWDHYNFTQESYNNITSVTADGNLITDNNSKIATNTKSYSMDEALEYKDSKDNNYILSLTASHQNQKDLNNQQSIITGLQHIEQTLSGTTNTATPNITLSFFGNHHFAHPGDILAVGLILNMNQNKITQTINNYSKYYNNDTSLERDSLLIQLLHKKNATGKIDLQSSYVKQISTQALVEFKYIFKSTKNDYKQETNWADKEGKMQLIDSLSNQFDYPIFEHKAGINIKRQTRNMDFIVGASVWHVSYNDNHANWLLPELNIKYQLSKASRLSFRYEGLPIYPDFQQLRPIPDRSNPLFPIIGNPQLKAGLYNIVSIDYRHAAKSILLITFRATPVMNKTVANTILIHNDTLGNIIQETHYLNTQGAYALFGSYSWSYTFSEGQYQVFLRGNANYNNNIFYLESLRNSSQNLTLSQSIRGGIYQKWMELNADASYSLNHISYSNSQTPATAIGSWNINLNTKFFAGASWSCWIDLTKQYNTGYANGVSANPTYLGATIEKTFFKKSLSCRLQGFNLLDQNSGIAQTISANTTTQTRTNQLGRYIMLSLLLDLKKTKK